jgi:hypothetical protein
MPANVEELSNDDLLVQLNELCEEVGWRIIEYLQAVDRDKLAEGATFAAAVARAVECRPPGAGRLDGLSWRSKELAERAAEASLRPRDEETFASFLDEHPELDEGDDA